MNNDEVIYKLGDLVSVVYQDEDGTRYYHEFNENNRPALCYNEDGSELHILGGEYVVDYETGIEG